jgi:hypothetical protein
LLPIILGSRFSAHTEECGPRGCWHIANKGVSLLLWQCLWHRVIRPVVSYGLVDLSCLWHTVNKKHALKLSAITLHWGQCVQEVKNFEYLSCETSYENENDTERKLEKFAHTLGILNSIFKPSLVQKCPRIKLYNHLLYGSSRSRMCGYGLDWAGSG